MFRLLLPLLTMVWVVAAGCGGSQATAPAAAPDREATRSHHCPQHFAIDLSCTHNPHEPAHEHHGFLAVDTCAAPHGFDAMGVVTLDGHNFVRIPLTEHNVGHCPTTYEGSKTTHRTGDHHGVDVTWTLSVNIDDCHASPHLPVSGTLSRTRTRWSIDEHGHRHEETEVLSCHYTGIQSAPPGGG